MFFVGGRPPFSTKGPFPPHPPSPQKLCLPRHKPPHHSGRRLALAQPNPVQDSPRLRDKLARFIFEKDETRGGSTAPSGQRRAENRVFSAKSKAVWFEARSVSNGKYSIEHCAIRELSPHDPKHEPDMRENGLGNLRFFLFPENMPVRRRSFFHAAGGLASVGRLRRYISLSSSQVRFFAGGKGGAGGKVGGFCQNPPTLPPHHKKKNH